MASITLSLTAFVFILGGVLVGIFLRAKLPEDHLSVDSRIVVIMAMGLVVTMSALVLGLLISSAKAFYDTQTLELAQLSANVILLDRLLAHYGPEAREARSELREDVGRALEEMWLKDRDEVLRKTYPTANREIIYDEIQDLTPKDDAQRGLKFQAAGIALEIGRTRRLMVAQTASSVPILLLVILIFWLTIIFTSFGLYAPTNGTVLAVFLYLRSWCRLPYC